MKKLFLIVALIATMCSCGNKVATNENDVDSTVVDSIEVVDSVVVDSVVSDTLILDSVAE